MIKPSLATQRYVSETEATVTTHDEVNVPCITWPSQQSLESLWNTEYGIHKSMVPSVSFIVVDEAQFCKGLIPFLFEAERRDLEVVLVGLNGTFQRKSFMYENESWTDCVALADKIHLLHALCTQCRDGTPGHFTHRKIQQATTILVGSSDVYETLCRSCFRKANGLDETSNK